MEFEWETLEQNTLSYWLTQDVCVAWSHRVKPSKRDRLRRNKLHARGVMQSQTILACGYVLDGMFIFPDIAIRCDFFRRDNPTCVASRHL